MEAYHSNRRRSSSFLLHKSLHKPSSLLQSPYNLYLLKAVTFLSFFLQNADSTYQFNSTIDEEQVNLEIIDPGPEVGLGQSHYSLRTTIQNCIGFSLFCSEIGLKSSLNSLSQWDAKQKPILGMVLRFNWSNLLASTQSSPRPLVMFP